MWDAPLIKALSRLARPGATVATYTCARAVRDALGANGFAVEIVPGYGHKREMLRARYRPAWKMRRHEPPGPHEGPQRAIVIGAGLAGCCCAFALRRRGWQVTLLERGATVAPAASGLPAGLLHPLLSADDNLASRLSRAGFAYGLAQLRSLEPPASAAGGQGVPARSIWSDCGVFHQAEDAAGAGALRAALAADPWPTGFAQYRDATEIASHLGLTPRHGGIWFAGGAVVAAGRWCAALLEAMRAPGTGQPLSAGAPEHPPFELVLDAQATDLVRREEGWQIHDALGRRYEAPVLVLANAGAITGLQHLAAIELQQIGGRISLLQDPALRALRAGISGDGYLVPPLLGTAAAVGATYELTGAGGACAADREPYLCGSGAPQDLDKNAAAHAANLQRLQRLLVAPPEVQVQGMFAAQRCVSPDRLPLAGRLVDPAQALAGAARLRGAHLPDLPRLPGLYCLAALGSRGLSLAALLGEHLAAQICGEPAPIESDLSAAVDPGRFVLRGR
jgi:tRNA 5-methylaminomethyl-2-thiouridine biosynthesis bifunctional protein